ncbi:MAG: ECF transporter S component [Candidatus Lokiarchaeota archaeon]|nr:ECF transporter S component [Candidatus Lokiarchaeota archaeon]
MELESEVKKTSEKVEVLDVDQEISNYSTWLERKSFRIVLISTFSALAIVLGYLLAYIPNIELFTLTIFLSGFILGKRDGMIIGFLSSFIFCFFNPLGASPLPLLAFQLTHYSITGLIGALTSDLFQKKISFESNDDLYKLSVMFIFGVIGALITSSFQILSSLVEVLSYFGTLDEYLPYFLTGLIFTAIHIIGNTLGFIFILPGLIQLIKKMLY